MYKSQFRINDPYFVVQDHIYPRLIFYVVLHQHTKIIKKKKKKNIVIEMGENVI